MQGTGDEAEGRYFEMVQELLSSTTSEMISQINNPHYSYFPVRTAVEAFKGPVTSLMREVARLQLEAAHRMGQQAGEQEENDGQGGRS